MSEVQRINFLYILLVGLFLLIRSNSGIGQGCSDAGFCTMGALKPNQAFTGKKKFKLITIEGGTYFANTKFGDVMASFLTDFNFGIGPKTTFQIKLPYNTVHGRLANTYGIGDLCFSLTRNLVQTEKSQLNLTIGGKLPSNNANKLSEDNRPLPMYYQTSLGTYDVVTGISFITRNWLIAAGYQQPFNANGNTFKWGKWEGSPLESKAREYPVSNHLRRGNDVMFRIEKNWRASRFNTYLGILSIYRINKDKIISPQTGQEISVTGSDGLAMSLLYGFGYKFSTKCAFKFLISRRVVRRVTNPDGLSRDFVNTLTFEYRF
jgi:hypothetical protein